MSTSTSTSTSTSGPVRIGEGVELHLGDCLEVLRGIPDGSVDAVVTDPPGGIGFMGKEWDRAKGRREFVDFLTPRLAECLRVAKPGAYLLCWAIPRTSHWTATAIEDAGWIIRDRVSHIFGTGFPKGKACLKPAVEDWWLAWKPAAKVTPLRIDECRIATDWATDPTRRGWKGGNTSVAFDGGSTPISPASRPGHKLVSRPVPAGRYPANLALSHSPGCNGECVPACPVRLLDEQAGERPGNSNKNLYSRQDGTLNVYGEFPEGRSDAGMGRCDTGGASRFFATFGYFPKASRKDRNDGLDGLPLRRSVDDDWVSESRKDAPSGGITSPQANHHPTVKSTDLMRWLIRLIAAPGDTILDPFTGSGSTGKAAVLEGCRFVGVEQSSDYLAIARRRIAAELDKTALLNPAT